MITLTGLAVKEPNRLVREQGRAGMALRVFVSAEGCCGKGTRSFSRTGWQFGSIRRVRCSSQARKSTTWTNWWGVATGAGSRPEDGWPRIGGICQTVV